jgi:hypothetical protein
MVGIKAKDTNSEYILFSTLLLKNNYSKTPQCYIIVYLLSYVI